MREQGTTSRWGPLGVVVALVASLTSVGVVAAAGPASAEVSVAVNVANGTIGVQQTVSATVDSSALGAPSGTVTFTANGTAIGSQPVGGTLGTKAQVAWTPASSGSLAVLATFVTTTESTSDSQTVQIARVEQELLWAHRHGMQVPPYIARAFREAVESAEARAA